LCIISDVQAVIELSPVVCSILHHEKKHPKLRTLSAKEGKTEKGYSTYMDRRNEDSVSSDPTRLCDA
jgi:hypothetical protein